ncbi:MAG TPA: precorrin-4 C(11)-methyltransferase [Pseudonocardiaceae bacterium]|jgi:precorrin-4 C11-methyltransferase|nr:precorrin-4 C(11)-methyltransferase [Pseudonocardiaceae bacterium]
MTSGRVSFIGAGPGAADLITLRGAKRIAEADIVVWAASLVDPECVREHARPDAELIDSSLITHEDVVEIYRRAAGRRLKVARVHSGDPALWGAVQEQYDACVRLGLEAEIVPGVSAFSAAAAIAGRELTVPEVAQSVILTRLEGGKTPMPDGEHIREFARHGTTMAIFLSAARSGQLVEELRAGGYPDDTPVVVAYKVTWPDEMVLHTTVGELEETVKQHRLWRHTLFLVGKSLRAGGTRSHLYHAGHFHTYRKADPAARRALRAAERGEVQPEPTADDGAPHAKASGWSLQTSRSGWATARVTSTGSWTGGRTDSGGQSVAAWSAVHGWQETARSAKSGGKAARSDSRPSVRPVPDDQETLALEAAEPRVIVVEHPPAAEEPAAEQRPAVEQPVVDGKPTLTVVPPPEKEKPRPPAQRQGGNRKAGAKRGNAGRKVAGRSTQAKSGDS